MGLLVCTVNFGTLHRDPLRLGQMTTFPHTDLRQSKWPLGCGKVDLGLMGALILQKDVAVF